jgi:hypothetical protein
MIVFPLFLFVVASVRSDTTRCLDAAHFLRESQRMAIEIDADTVDDWRTAKRLVGCRVTGAGSSDVELAQGAARFYARLRRSGWIRTPDPRDAPNESSLRFRRNDTDCLFTLYQGALLQTEAEGRVMSAHQPLPGETTRYQVMVQCTTALPAAVR